MSQQNVNSPAPESKESSFLKGHGDHGEAGELLGDNFFAPVEADLVDSLLGRYPQSVSCVYTHAQSPLRAKQS